MKRCPFECHKQETRYGSKQDMYVVPAPCTGKPLKNGWCNEHQPSQDLLLLGAQLGYPRMQVNIVLWIGAGRDNWEYAARRFRAERLEQAIREATQLHKNAVNLVL